MTEEIYSYRFSQR